MDLPMTPLLTAEQEIALAETVEVGLIATQVLTGTCALAVDATEVELRAVVELGHRAEQDFLIANLRLVRMIASRVAASCPVPEEDLFQEGCLGLAEAIRRFDHRRRVRFASYAFRWVRARVVASIADHATIRRARPRPDESESPLVFVPLVEAALPGSLDAGFEELERQEIALSSVLTDLSESQHRAVALRYGLGGLGPHSYAEAGVVMGVSAATVRRLERRGLAIARRLLDRAGILSSEAARLSA